jgi:charged multivesicular body protein 4A/B
MSLASLMSVLQDIDVPPLFFHRDELREQHALGEEIASAITRADIGEPIDEADLEEELEGMEQEAMDERMLKTGTLPVAGEVDRLPQVGNGKLKAQPAEEEDEEEELRKLQAEMAM